MRPEARKFRGAAGVLLGLVFASVGLLPPDLGAFDVALDQRRPPPPPPPPRHPFSGDFDDDFGAEDYNWTILRMQREGISAAEEQVREAGRTVRRAEVEEQQKQQSQQHEEYFQSVLETSQAALRAPRGAYFRKPGDMSQEAPANARRLEVGGMGYLYDQGVFWLLPGPPFIVVIPPVGAVVNEIPAAAFRVAGNQGARYYYFGTFFEEKGGKYEVIAPPVGTLVSYLPDGYRFEQVQGATWYRYGQTLFRPVFVQGVLVYQVVER